MPPARSLACSLALLLAIATRSWQELRYRHATRCGRSVSGTVRCGSAVAGGSGAFPIVGRGQGAGAAACIVSLAPFRPLPPAFDGAPFAPRSLASSLTAPETLPDLAPNCALRSDPANYVSSLPAHPAPLATLAPHPCLRLASVALLLAFCAPLAALAPQWLRGHGSLVLAVLSSGMRCWRLFRSRSARVLWSFCAQFARAERSLPHRPHALRSAPRTK